jgi:DNA-directed RNA polymerase specialized sigma24 family protein
MEVVAPAAAGQAGELAAHTRTEDLDAFTSLYQRHFAGVFDFVLRVVRDRAMAVDVMLTAFRKASEEGQPVENADAWLYAIVRDCAIEALPHRRRYADSARTGREGFEFTRIDADRLADPSVVLFDKELIELVWDWVAALSAEEYSLLDLHLRRGFSADGAAQTRLSRLRDAMDNAIAATLLAKRGRRSCAKLDALVCVFELEQTAREVRRAVEQHVRECRQCREIKSKFVSASEVFGSLAAVSPAPGLQEEIAERLQGHSNGRVRSKRLFGIL